ncbi:uncharacterized protein MONOS_5277 [Monocercomonoides exilis]|uniref:uncharacterized protein n=1 Tax=Monocercomonoides exilis TaxID=2049356 RepID=UPI0035599501|nr:hypothetical protein MONOS_5277 [Monocercomonoides exilis]|eukprot:MONOS_5277.1-p1 / transcript=MONOS_5277.1 / gene=MONOS_5277 / organism=Monocercomonoides_exilis_PA203 / gene_product=unspecified product / transcript_product=unspecified product / location=Mono_scaffold00151:103724-105055(-) / protein_length=259 / sequence_SO=supercontig / SO=protein_coding / is_pseudo=false
MKKKRERQEKKEGNENRNESQYANNSLNDLNKASEEQLTNTKVEEGSSNSLILQSSSSSPVANETESPGKSVRTAASTHAPNKFSPQIKLSRRARTTTRTSKLLKAANLLQNNTTFASTASSASASSNVGFPTASFPISSDQTKNSSSSSSSSSVSLLSVPTTALGRSLKKGNRLKALAAFKRTVCMKTHTGSRIAFPEFKSEVLGLINKMPPKMKRKRTITAMGLSQQGQKSEGGAGANVTVQNARRLESTDVTLES